MSEKDTDVQVTNTESVNENENNIGESSNIQPHVVGGPYIGLKRKDVTDGNEYYFILFHKCTL